MVVSADIPSGATIALCASQSQVEQLATDRGWRKEIGTFVALTPDAAWALMIHSIGYEKLETFYDERELCDQSQTRADLEMAWIRWVDSYLQGAIREFGETNFRPAACAMVFLKVMADVVFMEAFALEHMLARCQPGRVLYFEPEPDVFGPDLYFGESLHALVLPVVARRWDVPLQRLERVTEPATHAPQQQARTWPYLRSLVRAILSPAVVERLRPVRNGQQPSIAPGRTGRLKAQTIVLKDGHDVGPLRPQVERAALHAERWADLMDRVRARAEAVASPQSQIHEAWNRIVDDANFWTVFRSLQGTDCREVVASRLRFWWHHLIPESWQTFVAARQVLSLDRPGALVVPFVWGHHEVAVMHAARSIGVPAVIYQHGGFVGNCEDVGRDFIDLPNADYILVYGQGTAGYYHARGARSAIPFASPIPVGSARLDEVRQRTPRQRGRSSRFRRTRRPTVLYFSDPYKQPRYLNCSSLPPVSLFEVQTKLFRLFGEFPHLRFLYKAHPVGNSVAGELAKRTCPGCEVVSGIPLTQLVWDVDAIIADNASTGLLEALLTRKRIVLYADGASTRMVPEARALLARRVLLAETPADFLKQVRSLLTAGDFSELESPDTSFLRAYATHLDDGRSAERAVQYLQQVMSQQPEGVVG